MSLLLRVRGFYLLNKQEKTHKIAWIADIASFTNSCGPQRKRFHRRKNLKNCYAFHYYHCYLSILALLSGEIIDPLSSLSCRYYFVGSISTPHVIWTFRHSCHLAFYKLKTEGNINYFHSKTFLGFYRHC